MSMAWSIKPEGDVSGGSRRDGASVASTKSSGNQDDDEDGQDVDDLIAR
jgi:hypothetical protein